MTTDVSRFAVFVLVSLIVFVAIVAFVLRKRSRSLAWARLVAVASIVVVGGMTFAKYGHNAGLPWWVYYTLPALVTFLLPPLAFDFNRRELT